MMTFVPKQFVRMKSSLPSIERSTWLSAAKCTTASHPRMADSTSPGLQMLPLTKEYRGLSSTSRIVERLPAYVSAS